MKGKKEKEREELDLGILDVRFFLGWRLQMYVRMYSTYIQW